MQLYAVCAPGLEAVLAAELGALGAGDVAADVGGVSFAGDARAVWRANVALRTATRVLARVGTVRARDFAALRKGVAALDWAPFAARGATVACHVTAKKCRLYHTGGIAERVAAGVADRVGAGAGGPPLPVHVRGEHDEFVISVDSSGEMLYRRGWRVDTAPASLRETLAAGLLALAGWRPDEPLVDPMCGAGTIPIEAALRALGRSPGATRAFGFQTWPGFDAAAFAAAVAELGAGARAAPPAPIVAGDRDAAAVTLARRNAERAGVAAVVTFFTGDAAAVPLPDRPGLIVVNPPYGKRLPEQAALQSLAALRRRARGWRLAVLAPPAVLRAARLGTPSARHPLVNGGLRVELSVY
jgi:putative N6-adenine-specific DNA methylase